MCQNPGKYIKKHPSLRVLLRELKNRGKKLFIATNNHLVFTDMLMVQTLGRNWKKLFDINIINCRKPLFQRANNPFITVDNNG